MKQQSKRRSDNSSSLLLMKDGAYTSSDVRTIKNNKSSRATAPTSSIIQEWSSRLRCSSRAIKDDYDQDNRQQSNQDTSPPATTTDHLKHNASRRSKTISRRLLQKERRGKGGGGNVKERTTTHVPDMYLNQFLSHNRKQQDKAVSRKASNPVLFQSLDWDNGSHNEYAAVEAIHDVTDRRDDDDYSSNYYNDDDAADYDAMEDYHSRLYGDSYGEITFARKHGTTAAYNDRSSNYKKRGVGGKTRTTTNGRKRSDRTTRASAAARTSTTSRLFCSSSPTFTTDSDSTMSSSSQSTREEDNIIHPTASSMSFILEKKDSFELAKTTAKKNKSFSKQSGESRSPRSRYQRRNSFVDHLTRLGDEKGSNGNGGGTISPDSSMQIPLPINLTELMSNTTFAAAAAAVAAVDRDANDQEGPVIHTPVDTKSLLSVEDEYDEVERREDDDYDDYYEEVERPPSSASSISRSGVYNNNDISQTPIDIRRTSSAQAVLSKPSCLKKTSSYNKTKQPSSGGSNMLPPSEAASRSTQSHTTVPSSNNAHGSNIDSSNKTIPRQESPLYPTTSTPSSCSLASSSCFSSSVRTGSTNSIIDRGDGGDGGGGGTTISRTPSAASTYDWSTSMLENISRLYSPIPQNHYDMSMYETNEADDDLTAELMRLGIVGNGNSRQRKSSKTKPSLSSKVTKESRRSMDQAKSRSSSSSVTPLIDKIRYETMEECKQRLKQEEDQKLELRKQQQREHEISWRVKKMKAANHAITGSPAASAGSSGRTKDRANKSSSPSSSHGRTRSNISRKTGDGSGGRRRRDVVGNHGAASDARGSKNGPYTVVRGRSSDGASAGRQRATGKSRNQYHQSSKREEEVIRSPH